MVLLQFIRKFAIYFWHFRHNFNTFGLKSKLNYVNKLCLKQFVITLQVISINCHLPCQKRRPRDRAVEGGCTCRLLCHVPLAHCTRPHASHCDAKQPGQNTKPAGTLGPMSKTSTIPVKLGRMVRL